MWTLTLTATLLLVLSPGCFAGNHKYWWMNNPSVFSSGGGGQQQYQQQQQQPINSNLGSQNNYNTPSQSIDQQDDSYVETECPVGTKCVQDHFCNEQAVMVSYRVDLTPAQKRNRGKLIPCVSSGNGGFDVCCSTSSGSSSSSSSTFISSSNNNNNNQGFSGELRQPVQQQQQQTSFSTSNTIPTGECPNIAVLPPVESCSQRTSNCWSVGQADVDCENNALCCFDGCVNACYFGGSSGSSSSSTSFSSGSSRIPSSSSSTNFQSSGGSFPSTSFSSGSGNVPSTNFQSSGTFQDSSSTFEEQPAPTNIHSSSTSFQSSVPATTFVDSSSSSFQESVPVFVEEESNPPAFPTPAPSYSQGSFSQQVDNVVPETSYIPPPQQQQQTFTPPRKQQQQQQKPFNPPRQQTNFQSSSSSSSSSSTFQSADTKPFVTCPSAMKCVPRVNCDFNGVMVEQTLNLTPELEMLRVPLIPCVNPQTTNIDVCCRDPNYTDPWPMDNGNGNGNGGNGNFIGNGNGGNFKGNDDGGYSGNNQGVSNGIVPRTQAQPELVKPVAHQQQAPRRSSYGK